MNPLHATPTSRRWALELLGAAAVSLAITIVLTWPQALYPYKVADHFDPYFSVWRLGHIAHALRRWPIRLFDGNIFFPATNTLAYSDATLLQGLIAAPFFWAGISPTLTYNVLLFIGFVGSGVGMYVLARHLTGAKGPSLVATAIFVALPYRFEHLMHLELQWAMFIPLSFWAVHRTMESGRWRHAVLLAVFLWLQFLSCVYYGVFLAFALIVFVPLLLTFRGHVPLRVWVPRVALAAVAAAALTLPYALPYAQATRTLGVRPLDEITRYSALPISYLATDELNRLWGWTADLWGAPELRLFPGVVAVFLALCAFRHSRRRLVGLYVVLTLVMMLLSFGMNSRAYALLLGHVSALQGFRALARFAIVFGCGLALLAALGTHAIVTSFDLRGFRRRAAVALIIVILIGEYSNRRIPLSYAIPGEPADAYKVLRHAEPGAIVEFPLPNPDSLPGFDPYYEAWSVWHWRPMLNGYSGFYSRHYLDVVSQLKKFPNAESVDLLRTLDVRYVIIHRGYYEDKDYTRLALKLAGAHGLRLWGVFRDPVGWADILEVVH